MENKNKQKKTLNHSYAYDSLFSINFKTLGAWVAGCIWYNYYCNFTIKNKDQVQFQLG